MKVVVFPTRSRRPRRAQRVPGRRLRVIGVLILIFGISLAGLVYWLETRAAHPTLEELMPGSSQANSRQMGILYGHAGVVMWEWREQLMRPRTQAGIIIAAASIVAFGCFRVAWLDAERARES